MHLLRSRHALAAVFIAAVAISAPAFAQGVAPSSFAGPFKPEMGHEDIPNREADIAAARAGAEKLGLTGASTIATVLPRSPRLGFPLKEAAGVKSFTAFGISNYLDHNNAQGALQDYTCGTRTYDLPDGYDHAGIDFFTAPFPWTTMDASNAFATAAYAGVVTAVRSGEADRSCGNLSTLPTTTQPNFVAIRQDDGYMAYYYHFKRDSIPAAVTVGARVAKGDVLGVIGSSGFSSGPHLHFELRDEQNVAIDPMSGTCSPGAPLFTHQWNFRDTRVMRIGTHGAAPNLPSDSCVTETPNLKTVFQPGETIFVAPYMRDLLPGQTVAVTLFRPDGSTYGQASTNANIPEPYAWAYYYWSWNLPTNAPAGTWRARATVAGVTYEQAFIVGAAPAASGPVYGATLPGSRSVSIGNVATAFATILNTGAQAVRGCTIAPAEPIDADFSFQTTNPSTNALQGTRDRAVDIAAGAAQTFLIAITPRTGASAQGLDLPFKFNCLNSDAAPIFANLNTLKLSFEANPVADVIALAGTVANDGQVRTGTPAGSGAFVVAATNIGAPAQLTVTPRKTSASMAGNLFVCETVPATGACKAGPTASVTRSFATGENTTWSVFLQGSGTAIPFDPANNRIAVEFEDAGSVSRGSTSVAARTD
ncbi:peptidoglycan DD-metalloendopeptidase family protein [bacterium]|nr:peptidoglycan DD-metalloendopeptidase family protein [bacterium]